MSSSDDAIEAFWRWWSGRYRDTLARAIDEGRVAGVVDPLFARLRKVHPNLVADLRLGTASPGETPPYALVIDANEEVPEGLIERMLAAAPAADDRWEYGTGEAPVPDPRTLVLSAGEHTVDLARMVVGMALDPDEMALELAVYHPDLAELPVEQQDYVASTALNAVAGHSPPRRYRAKLRLARKPPDGAMDLARLREELAALEA